MQYSLYHWTGRKQEDGGLKNLKSICSTKKLKMSFCPIGVKRLWENEIKMVCFTEEDPKIFNKQFDFGTYAIGFDREKIIEYGGNPVFYISQENENHVIQLKYHVEKISERLKDRELFKNLDGEIINDDFLESLLAVQGCFQEVRYKERKDIKYINSNQKEWRIGYHLLKNKSVMDDFPGSSCLVKEGDKLVRYLNFSISDIKCLIGKREKIQEVKNIGLDLGIDVEIIKL